MKYTILTPKEMAKDLGISRVTLKRRMKEDPNIPHMKVESTIRFVKEKVREYLELDHVKKTTTLLKVSTRGAVLFYTLLNI